MMDRLQLDASVRVDEDDLLQFHSVERQVVGPCLRLDVVKLGRPRVSVDGRDNGIRIVGEFTDFIADGSCLKITCIDHLRCWSNARSIFG